MRLFKNAAPPPSARIIEAVRAQLRKCATLEVAAALSGVPKKHLMYWIEAGRRGDPEYTPFVDMYDKETAQLAEKVMDTIFTEAFEERNLEAVKFLHKHRLLPNEKRFYDKMAEIEDRLEAERTASPSSNMSDTELAEAEKRAIEELETGVH